VRIPYSFVTSGDEAMDAGRIEAFNAAVNAIKSATCIEFYPSPTFLEYEGTGDGINVGARGQCSANLGYQSNRVGAVNLGWCKSMENLGSVIHELFHVVGVNHEQKRPDAEAAWTPPGGSTHGPYLTMHWENFQGDDAETWKNQFLPDVHSYTGSQNDGSDDPHIGYSNYDFDSIMHYGRTSSGWSGNAYTTIPAGMPTGQRSRIATSDAQQVMDMYQCIDKDAGTTDSNLDGTGALKVVDNTDVASPQCAEFTDGGTKSVMEVHQTSQGITVEYKVDSTWTFESIASGTDTWGTGTKVFSGYRQLRVFNGDLQEIDKVAAQLDAAIGKHQSFSYRYTQADHSAVEIVESYGWQDTAPAVPTEFKTIEGQQILMTFTKGVCTPAAITSTAACADKETSSFCAAQQSDSASCDSGKFFAKCENTCGACAPSNSHCDVSGAADGQCSGSGTCHKVGEVKTDYTTHEVGQCTCNAAHRGNTCESTCPADNGGQVCGGSGTCDAQGQCVCHGVNSGDACEYSNRNLTIVSKPSNSSLTVEQEKAAINDLLAQQTSVASSRYDTKSISKASDQETIQVLVKDPNYSPGLANTLLQTQTTKSAEDLVKEIKAAAADGSLKTGVLSGLESVYEHSATDCSADKFYSCADQSCMPKTDTLAVGGSCCAYDTVSGTSKTCEANFECQMVSSGYTCTASASTSTSTSNTRRTDTSGAQQQQTAISLLGMSTMLVMLATLICS